MQVSCGVVVVDANETERYTAHNGWPEVIKVTLVIYETIGV